MFSLLSELVRFIVCNCNDEFITIIILIPESFNKNTPENKGFQGLCVLLVLALSFKGAKQGRHTNQHKHCSLL